MLDQSIIGREYAPFSIDVEKGRIKAFAKSIGENNPIHFDEAAARAAGFPGLVAPPTFAWAIIMDAEQGFKFHEEFGIDKARTVHGEQGFVYHRAICAGDVISGQQRIIDFAEKRGGALQLVTTEIGLVDQHGQAVCEMQTVIVVRNV